MFVRICDNKECGKYKDFCEREKCRFNIFVEIQSELTHADCKDYMDGCKCEYSYIPAGQYACFRLKK